MTAVPDGVTVLVRHFRRVVGDPSGLYLRSTIQKQGLTVDPRGGKTTVELHDGDVTGPVVAYGEAFCDERDNYHKALGRVIALGRALAKLAQHEPDAQDREAERVWFAGGVAIRLPDGYVVTADALNDLRPATWPEYHKVATTRAVRVQGPFVVNTSEGPLRCEDGYLAVDARGYPYPIDAGEFALIYEPGPAR